ncbi:MAG: YajQ family cyclic di-GMP-binding protein [Polyangiales bacterium]|nr:YajQ family cyclic di-GMP-binding protein [Sandaracinus sp.]
MPTFDVVCKLDRQEVVNAVDQTSREIAQRFDFKGTNTSIELNDDGIVLRSSSEGRVDGARDVLEQKLIKRKVSLKTLDPQKTQPAGGSTFRQLLKLKEGISTEKAKEIVKAIKDSKLKVQASIQGDSVRVTGKKRDDLQECIAFLREQDFDLPLLYQNFRD